MKSDLQGLVYMSGKAYFNTIITLQVLIHWCPSWLDCGALINVDAPGCGTSVVSGPTEDK